MRSSPAPSFRLPPAKSAPRDELIVVNSRDRAIGRAEKHAAHAEGLLHRAFSICLVDARGRMLLQQRSPAKYHSGGLWANTCCGHPRPGERTLPAARRRLREELGIGARLRFGFVTRYDATFANGLTENEIVHVYFGRAPAGIQPNPAEVAAIDWLDLPELRRRIRRAPDAYAVWLQHYVLHHYDLISAGVTAALAKPERPSP